MGHSVQEPNSIDSEMFELISIMREATSTLDPTENVKIVQDIQEIMKAREGNWRTETEKAKTEARTVAEAHNSARIASLRPPNVPSEEQQARAISSLDEAQFRVIKSINDAEGVLSSRQNERVRARGELGAWEAKDVDEDVASVLDTNALRIRLSKELGFEPVIDRNTGKITKMIVRNDDNTDMDVVELAGLSEFEIANQLWDKATTVDRSTS
ncbi:Spc24 subunit of Ndc80 protein [Rhizoctonia solani 123E]|uniref:Kinetochore protein Spc24 n=1 Tax=Rhizoctonia solani 123E TaxID=1423351 RepID=A0A074RUX7_9AGAM|nr:Spc24 subunit of Ndc80 protein [Rhizoctonia solani 123E]